MLAPFLGSNFFPSVDGGLISMHVRAPVGLRLEETSLLFGRIEQNIHDVVPDKELDTVVDNIGIPNSSINAVYNNSGTIGPQDGDIFISLKEGHRPTAAYVKLLRQRLARDFPGVTFSFPPADIISQILNFGSPAPIDVQVAGPNDKANRAYVSLVMRRMAGIPGLVDMRLQQPGSSPQLRLDIDRSHIAQLGLTQRDVTNSILASLAGSGQVSPTIWLNPKNGVSYPIVAQTAEYRMNTISSLENIPVTGAASNAGVQVLGGLGTFSRDTAPAVINHYDVQPVLDVFATTQGRDLGGVATDIRHILKDTAKERPKGATITLRGQAVTMDTAFSGLFFGLIAAVVLIYLLIVVNFQSWIDPFVIITALPAALAASCGCCSPPAPPCRCPP